MLVSVIGLDTDLGRSLVHSSSFKCGSRSNRKVIPESSTLILELSSLSVSVGAIAESKIHCQLVFLIILSFFIVLYFCKEKKQN